MSVVLSNVRSLTAEHIKGMAPDQVTLRTAIELARSERWGSFGYCRQDRSESGALADGRLFWAVFPEARHGDTRTTFTLPNLRATCTCSATRFPCRHVLAVLLRDLSEGFDLTETPEWVRSRNDNDVAHATAPVSTADSSRQVAIIAGMADLRVWLGDLIRQGLAGLPGRGRELWLDAADRLVDAYAFEAARELRECSLIVADGTDWPEKLLPRLGKLAMLCEAFQRFNRLSANEQGDALAAAAGPALPVGPDIRDDWFVVGRRTEIENRQRREHSWLFGSRSGRWAMQSVNTPMGPTTGICWPVGAVVHGGFGFYPSAAPFVAEPTGDFWLSKDPMPDPGRGATDIEYAIGKYAAALAANPWLRVFPMALRDVVVEPPHARLENRWRVRGRGGRTLSLPDRFNHGWQLLALAADKPFTLFGEWDGAIFTPLSVLDKEWQNMAAWRGLA